MKSPFLFTMIMIVAASCLSQSIERDVVSSSGDYFENENLSVSYTIGEIVTETFIGEGLILTQGFHQTSITLNLQVDIIAFLEGPFMETDMHTDVNALIPVNQPYNALPWNYEGEEILESIPEELVDWVLIELRDAADSAAATPATRIGRKAAVLLSDGSIRSADGTAFPVFNNVSVSQNLFAIIWHRNHIGLMSANPLLLSGGIYSYNFTTAAEQAYGDNQSDLGNGYYGLIAADMNADGTINHDDLLLWEQQSGAQGYLVEDADLSTQVNNVDKNDLWYQNRNEEQIIPE